MQKSYDRNNVFARILRSELPCKKVYEDEHLLAFHDIHPLTPTHVLIIPKGEYTCYEDFVTKAQLEVVHHFFKTVAIIAQDLNVSKDGYRLITNKGEHAHQEVPHFHIHILAGRPLGHKLVKS